MYSQEVWIVVITYNGEKWIKNVIQSLVNQTYYPHLKIFIVDNNSTDKTVEYAQKFVVSYENVKLYKINRNLGYGKGANIVLSKALREKIPWVFVLNQDIILERNCVEFLVENGNKYPKYGILTPLQLNYNNQKVDETMLWVIQQNPLIISDALLDKLHGVYPVPFVIGAAMFMRGEALKEVGLFDESFWLYGEDNDLCRRFRLFQWKLGLVPSARVYHWHSASKGYSHFIFIRRRAADYSLILKKPNRNLLLNFVVFMAALFILPVKYWDKHNFFQKIIGCWQGAFYAIRNLPVLLKNRARDISLAKDKTRLKGEQKKRILIGLGGGGFTWESLFLIKKMGQKYDYIYVTLKQFEEVQKIPFPGQIYKISSPSLIGQNIFQKIFCFIKSFMESLIIIIKSHPDVVINIGSSLAIPLSFWGKVFKKKVIFIQCVTRVKTLSLTDKIIYKLNLVDKFYTQWPYLSKKYGFIYKGRLI